MKPNQRIIKFIKDNHVLSLSVCVPEDNSLWACNAFYVFDEELLSFYIFSEMKTIHAKAMLVNPKVAGTVCVTPRTVAKIQGIQYQAIASLLEAEAAQHAYRCFYDEFPFARVVRAPIWALELQHIKMTNNLLGFAHKDSWTRGSPE